MPNRIALVVHYLACFKAGLVATPLNYRYATPEIDHALEVSDASALVVHVERRADITATRLGMTLPIGIITYGDPDGAVWPAGATLEALTAESDARHRPRRTGAGCTRRDLLHVREHRPGQGRDAQHGDAWAG